MSNKTKNPVNKHVNKLVKRPRDIPNDEGFKFTAIDLMGCHHACVVVKTESGTFKVESPKITYNDIVVWFK